MPASDRGTPEPLPLAQATGDGSWVGKCFEGRYRIEEQLGAGGMGRVFRARHLALDRLVALKVLRKQHSERWVSRKRFEREARALAQLVHPHIVAVTDCGIDGDAPFLVMELLEGVSLEARLREGALPPGLACRYALQLLDGLAFVHAQGLVHRDIKPGNIFLERTERGGERIKLLDFGLAKLVVQNTDPSVTRTGEVFGTPAYMSPEQISGEDTDARTDVYAVGLVLFEMLAGRRAFLGGESEMLRQQLVDPLPRLAQLRPEAAPLDAVLERATRKERGQRFADAAEMAAALAAAASRIASAGRPPSGVSRLPAPPPARGQAAARRAGSRRGEQASRVLRAGAVLVCGVALAAIAVAGGVIYLLDSPEGAERRVRLQRALSSVLEADGAGQLPAPTHSRRTRPR